VYTFRAGQQVEDDLEQTAQAFFDPAIVQRPASATSVMAGTGFNFNTGAVK